MRCWRRDDPRHRQRSPVANDEEGTGTDRLRRFPVVVVGLHVGSMPGMSMMTAVMLLIVRMVVIVMVVAERVVVTVSPRLVASGAA